MIGSEELGRDVKLSTELDSEQITWRTVIGSEELDCDVQLRTELDSEQINLMNSD